MRAKCIYHPEMEIKFFCQNGITHSLDSCNLPMCVICLPIHENDHRKNRQLFSIKNINEVIKHTQYQIQFQLSILKEVESEIKKMHKFKEQQFLQKIQNIKQICFNKIEHHINNIIKQIQLKKIKQTVKQQIQNHQRQLQKLKSSFSKNSHPKDIIEYKKSQINKNFEKIIHQLQIEKEFFSMVQIFVQPQVLQNCLKSFISYGQIQSNEKLTKLINQWKKHKQQPLLSQKKTVKTSLNNFTPLKQYFTQSPNRHSQKNRTSESFKNQNYSKFKPVNYDRKFNNNRYTQKKFLSNTLYISSPKVLKQKSNEKKIEIQLDYNSQIRKKLYPEKIKEYPMTTAIINKLFQNNQNNIANNTLKIKKQNNNNNDKKLKSFSEKKQHNVNKSTFFNNKFQKIYQIEKILLNNRKKQNEYLKFM